MNKLTIKQAAEAMKCSHQTIRRRISKGEIPARKEMTEFGEVWYIPADFVGVPTTTVDVVPLTHEVSLGEIEQLMAYTVGQAVESAIKKVIVEQTDPLRDEIQQLRSELDSHHRRLDERLRAAMPVKEEKKGFWARVLS